MRFLLLFAVFCSPVFSEEWKATLVKNLEALATSCVVLPCTFTQPKDHLSSSKLRGIWHLKDDKTKFVYHEDKTRILENYRGRTKLLGHLGQKNCSLEITDIRDHDNGPFCFRIELVESDQPTVNKFSFVEDCVTLKMLPDPPEPEVFTPNKAIEGGIYVINCSVYHTCPSHMPTLTWSRKDGEISGHHKLVHSGIWETQSTLTFTLQEKDNHTDVTCTAQFYGERTSSKTTTIYVKHEKRSDSYNHIIIPCAVGIGIIVIFTIFCILMVRKYKNHNLEPQNQEGTMWNRLSRISRRT